MQLLLMNVCTPGLINFIINKALLFVGKRLREKKLHNYIPSNNKETEVDTV